MSSLSNWEIFYLYFRANFCYGMNDELNMILYLAKWNSSKIKLPLWYNFYKYVDQGHHLQQIYKCRHWERFIIYLVFILLFLISCAHSHYTYSWNIKWQKCAGISGLWVLNEIIQKKYPENMKKIVGAVWKLPAK